MRWIGCSWLVALLLTAALAVAGDAAATATPVARPLHHAGLVVRHRDGRLTYAYVAFPGEAISGIDLLRRSTIPLVTVDFGGLGEGVCSLDGDGCPTGDCRKRLCQGGGADAPFWQYFRQVAPGNWQALPLGGSATKVHDGDVDGWSWTGDDPKLPAASLAEIARLTGAAAAAVSGGNGTVPPAAVHDVSPPGVAPRPRPARTGQGAATYAAAAALLALIGGGALYAVRRRRAGVRR